MAIVIQGQESQLIAESHSFEGFLVYSLKQIVVKQNVD